MERVVLFFKEQSGDNERGHDRGPEKRGTHTDKRQVCPEQGDADQVGCGPSYREKPQKKIECGSKHGRIQARNGNQMIDPGFAERGFYKRR